MPVYKIIPEDRGKRVLVTGSKLDEVISKGRKKLNLPDGSYKVHSYAVNQFFLIHMLYVETYCVTGVKLEMNCSSNLLRVTGLLFCVL